MRIHEMTSKQIVQRLLFARARFEIVKLKTGKPSKDDLRRIKAAAEEVANAKLFIDDTAHSLVYATTQAQAFLLNKHYHG